MAVRGPEGPCQLEPIVSVPKSVAEILDHHVTLELECIDRMYLNVYVPKLQYAAGAAAFFRFHRGATFASSALMGEMTRDFVSAIGEFVKENGIPVETFVKGQRKDDVALEHLREFDAQEGVVFVGKAQEKCSVFRTEKRRDPNSGATYPWLVRSTAMVNQYYFYCVDRDFGPFFLKFCSYFPYTAKLCINGHEYLKRQLDKKGISYEALDNGLLSCDEIKRAQRLSDGLSARKIDDLLRKWLRLLPHPFTPLDRQAGYRYDVSILQAEFALTQVLDRPLSGRILFEEIIRENLDIGRPDRVQLIFSRRVIKTTPGVFRTRVITEGVVPSLHVYYKHSKIKQYHKEGHALRTETTINNTRDFCIGKRLKNLPALREIGFQANRRLLSVQRISHDCAVSHDVVTGLAKPLVIDNQRVSALRFGDPFVHVLLSALLVFRLLPNGFSNKDLREHLAPLLGLEPSDFTPGRMTYQLRRLRLRGFIERIPRSHRYCVSRDGFRTSLYLTRLFARVLRPQLAFATDLSPPTDPLGKQLAKIDNLIEQQLLDAKLCA